MGKILNIVAAFIACCLAVSCNTSGCTDNRSSIPLAGFYSSGTGREITLDSLEVYGIGAPDSAYMLVAGEKASSVYLPMRSDNNTTSWCFHYCWKELDNELLNDTITFTYDSEPWFATDDCGAMYRYRLRTVSHTAHLIDSLTVTDSLVTNIDRACMNIYFRTVEAEPQKGTRFIKQQHQP